MKKGAFELGGSDPFIVLENADLDFSAEKAFQGRLKGNGQSCNNSKRFIVHESVYNQFVQKLILKLN